MENASKALIIAGAILLSILIISLGLMVYNQAKDTIGSVNLDEQQIAQFNDKFLTYEGTSKTAAQVNSLIQTVITSNQTAINNATGAYVGIIFPTVSDATTKSYVSISVNTSSGKVAYGAKTEADKSKIKSTDAPSTSNLTSYSSGSICKVASGKTYTVTITRTKSIVSSITVTQN